VVAALTRTLRLVSIVICMIVAVSFAIFAIQQTKTASGQQTETVNNSNPALAHTEPPPATTKKGAVHRVIDEASEAVTSPFSGIVSSGSEWAVEGVKLVLTLVIYGFGLGYVARVIRVRV
jgi:hypothetical protein